MKRFFALIVLAFLVSTNAGAWGWAHRLIAYIAYEHCTPTTKQELDRYFDLPIYGGMVAMFPDTYRSRPWAPADYSDAPDYTFQALEHAVCVDENCYPLTYSNRPDGNGVGYERLTKYIDNLHNYKNLPDSVVNIQLRMIIHFVGDLHCPGHILYSYDKNTPDLMGGGIAGGYGIWVFKWKGKTRNLHNLIDGADACHPEFNRNFDEYSNYLEGLYSSDYKKITAGTMSDWLHDVALRSKVIYTWYEPKDDVTDTFYTTKSHVELFDYIFVAAGYRLGIVLNELFDPEFKK